MRIAIGGDERNDVTDHVLEGLRKRGHELVKIVGPVGGRDEQWADVGRSVGEAVAGGEADQGIVFC
ncbi:MAG: RpiB/LacA/LacB family sugar-phosphate isomerase, partial [Actinomycetota bacterium]